MACLIREVSLGEPASIGLQTKEQVGHCFVPVSFIHCRKPQMAFGNLSPPSKCWWRKIGTTVVLGCSIGDKWFLSPSPSQGSSGAEEFVVSGHVWSMFQSDGIVHQPSEVWSAYIDAVMFAHAPRFTPRCTRFFQTPHTPPGNFHHPWNRCFGLPFCDAARKSSHCDRAGLHTTNLATAKLFESKLPQYIPT